MDDMVIEANRNGMWETIEMKGLKDGDVFQMFDPETGKQFIGDNESIEWKVMGDPYLNEDDIWSVNVEDP